MWDTSFPSVMLLQKNQASTQDTRKTVTGEPQLCSGILRPMLSQFMEVPFLKTTTNKQKPWPVKASTSVECLIALLNYSL